MLRLVAAGLSHHTAPLELRERAVVSASDAVPLLRYLVGHAGLAGAAVLSTCNRTELYVTCPAGVAGDVLPRLRRYLDPGAAAVGEHIVSFRDADAVRHMMRVASGLESMVVGEAQVLGQFKAAHELARTAQTLDPRLGFVMRRAISVGKRVRTETEIGRGVSGITDTAIEWSRGILGDLSSAGALIFGAGEMATLAARRLAALGARLYITSPGGRSAAGLAGAIGASAVPEQAIPELAPGIDLVLCSTDSPSAIVGEGWMRDFQAARSHRPLCVVDIAVPRDVHPDCSLVPGVAILDLDELGARIAASLGGRQEAVPEAEAIIEEELGKVLTAIDEGEAVVPTISRLVRAGEEVRRREVERTLARMPGLDPAARERIDRLSRSLVGKLLHGPVTHLRENAGDPEAALVIREVFDLDLLDPGASG